MNAGIHQHPEMQLEFILDGEFTFEIEDNKIPLSPYDALFIPPHVPHTWRCKDRGAMIGVIVEISGPDTGTYVQKMKESALNPSPEVRSAPACRYIHEIINSMQDSAGKLWAVEKLSMLVELWLLELLRDEFEKIRWTSTGRSVIKVPRERSRESADNIMHFLENNYMHPVNLNNIMLHIGLSARHANRIFKDRYNETISQALMRIRLDHALKQLQAEPNVPIKTVAYNTGFASTSYFTRCFREAFGMPPKYVRKGQGLNIRRIQES